MSVPNDRDVSQGEVLRAQRHWQFTHFGSTLPVNGVKDSPYHLIFTVMSYNVLSQDLLESHRYLYHKHKARALKWKHRSHILYSEIQEANADIVCLQEVQANQLQRFYHQLNYLGYASIYKQRTGSNVDGIAIYYKRDVFELVDHTSVEYFQPGVSVLDRHNVGLVAKLAVRANPSRYLVVATTHLLYNPRRQDVKLAQMQILLAEVERFAFKGFSSGNPTYWPVIITGDMNFEPYTGVYRLLTEGMFRYEGLSNTLTSNFHGRVLSKELLPRSLDIADTCQHWGILCMRAIQKLDSKTQLQFLKIHNTDHQKILQLNMISQTPVSFEGFVQNARMMEHVNNFVPFFGPSAIPPLPDAGYATGQLTHNLNLCSVYQHGEKDNYPKSEVTTHQGSWVTVDYIFYSCVKNERDRKITEGNLKLVSRYRLLTASEADSLGRIPNDVSPSDHYPLLATFFYMF